jgi:DNA-binding SARP family transcriptional activator
MLRYKVTPPQLPVCVDRPRLLRRVLPAPVVVLAAPAGHGKTCLAAQVAADTSGPVAWFLADELDRDRAGVVAQLLHALAAAWSDLGDAVPGSLDDDLAVPVLGSALETLAGPGCLVMDDVHLLPPDVLAALVHTALAALPPDCRLVICTRGNVPEAVLRAEATSRAVTVGPAELVFDEEECGRVGGSPDRGADIHARTGGWPLAVALWTQVHAGTMAVTGSDTGRAGRLAELALAELPAPAGDLLVVLARLPRFPAPLLRRLDHRYAPLEPFGRSHPGVVSCEDGWWSPREWVRDALRERPADVTTVDAVARALCDLDEHELAAQLFVAEARYESAVPLLERIASAGMRRGRAAWVLALVGTVPSAARSFTLDLLAASAAQALNLVDEAPGGAGSELALLELVDRSAAEGPGAQLRARGLLASHYRMEADARMFSVCEAALGDALHVEDPRHELAGRWSDEDTPAAAEMLRLYGHAQRFARDRETVEHGRRLVAAALDLLDAAGQPTTSLRGWSLYFEVLLFLRRADQAVQPVRRAAHRLADLEHSDAAVRLAELATVEYFAAQYPAARRTVELARDCADRTGNRVALAPLAAIEVALDVLDAGFETEHARRFDDVLAQLEAHPRLASFAPLITAEFGIVLVDQGQPDVARHHLARAEQALDDTFFSHTTSFRCRRLRGRLLLADGRTADARSTLDALRRDAAAEGREALVDLVTDDLAGRGRSISGARKTRAQPAPVRAHVLAPELSVTVDGEGVPAPRGYPAKLLALLIAADGSLTVDAAIEGLWPGADPDVGRNRLHGVLLRLRRGLGLPADGPISCAEGVVRLERSHRLEVDSWEFEALAARTATAPEARATAVDLYRHDFLSVQFAYDDTVAAYRRALRRSFLDLATAVLANPPDGTDANRLASWARRAWLTAPADDRVCLAAVRTLARLGQRAEARELVDATAGALREAGLDGDGFRRRTLPVIDNDTGGQVTVR